MIKGIAEIREKTQETQQMSGRNWITRLIIKDGETATLRFLSDVEEKDGITPVIQDLFHDIEEISPRGKRFRTKYCIMRDTGVCQYCASGNSPKKYIFLWAYVYNILHKSQNPALEYNPESIRWAQIKVGIKVFFREDINAIRLFRTGVGGKGYIKNLFLQYADEYGTFCDRDYRWTRTGSTIDNTVYNLIAKEATKMSNEILAAQKTLPDLEKVALGETMTFGQPEEPKTEEDEVSFEENGIDLF